MFEDYILQQTDWSTSSVGLLHKPVVGTLVIAYAVDCGKEVTSDSLGID